MTFLFPLNKMASCERPSIVIVDHYPLSRSCFARILRCELQDYTILEIETLNQLDSIVGKHISLVALNIGSSAMTDQRVLKSLAYVRRLLADGPLILLTRLEESTISDAMISEVTASA